MHVVDDHLVVQLGPDDYRLTLDHWDGDTFSFAPNGEHTPHGSLSSATFEIDPDGPDTLSLQFFDTHGLATWTR